ncbi:NAD(P)H-hydrate dehydratase [Arthrobacter rhombi]|uniref:NAD(P)H-hydrate dehydratase n=1 Tax=Arthrobacter rhombi TaxID=71253 RepID=UPI003FD1919B
MINAYTGTQIRAAEAGLLQGQDGASLMRRAAHGLAHHTMNLLRESFGGVYGARIAALIGSGNNGGDALFAMARLASRGVACTAVVMAPKVHVEGLAAFKRAGGKVVEAGREGAAGSRGRNRRWHRATEALNGADLVIDAVLGTGARGSVSMPTIPDDILVVACDLPSGVNADTGSAPDAVLQADLTVTFGAMKTGLTVGAGHLLSGRVEVVDIGLSPYLGEPDLFVMEDSDAHRLFPRPARSAQKYSRGVLGLVAGSDEYPGAAVLSATAAVNTGVGMLRTVTTETVRPLVSQAVPEAVAAHSVDPHVQAWAVGPGIGEDADQLAATRTAISSGLPCVVDASALAELSQGQGHSKLVLTPHAGELTELLQRAGMRLDREAVEKNPVRWARWAAVAYSSVVLLKGPATVCVAPDGPTIVSNNGGPELATAGSGDVLTGILGAMLAVDSQHGSSTRSRVELAATSAHVHAEAGRRIAVEGQPHAQALARSISRG